MSQRAETPGHTPEDSVSAADTGQLTNTVKHTNFSLAHEAEIYGTNTSSLCLLWPHFLGCTRLPSSGLMSALYCKPGKTETSALKKEKHQDMKDRKTLSSADDVMMF